MDSKIKLEVPVRNQISVYFVYKRGKTKKQSICVKNKYNVCLTHWQKTKNDILRVKFVQSVTLLKHTDSATKVNVKVLTNKYSCVVLYCLACLESKFKSITTVESQVTTTIRYTYPNSKPSKHHIQRHFNALNLFAVQVI